MRDKFEISKFRFFEFFLKNTIFQISDFTWFFICLPLSLPYFLTRMPKIESKKYESRVEKVEKHVFMLYNRGFEKPYYFFSAIMYLRRDFFLLHISTLQTKLRTVVCPPFCFLSPWATLTPRPIHWQNKNWMRSILTK